MNYRLRLLALAALLGVASCQSSATGPAVAQVSTLWRAQFQDPWTEIENLPQVFVGEQPSADGRLEIEVRNVGETTLCYWGYGPDMPQRFDETAGAAGWEASGWDWCGTGLECYEIAPGERVVFRLHLAAPEVGSAVRVLTGFTELGSERRSYVVLATCGAVAPQQQR